jgi:hypothetical protein
MGNDEWEVEFSHQAARARPIRAARGEKQKSFFIHLLSPTHRRRLNTLLGQKEAV